MDKKIVDSLKKIEFFSDNLSDHDISHYCKNTYRIRDKDRSYLIKLCEYEDIKKNESINEFEEFSKAINSGYLKEIDQNYQIFDFGNSLPLKDYLEKYKKKDQYNIGYKFGKILKNYHSIRPIDDFDWYKMTKTKANYLFYIHGISNDIGDKDYILVDYISHNIHLTRSVKTSYLLDDLSLEDIIIDNNEKINVLSIDFKHLGDPTYDFTSINKIAIKSPEFAKGSLYGYFGKNKIPIKFFRLLALYQAYLILKNMVNTRKGKSFLYSKDEENLLLLMYDDFNQEIPQWI